MPPNRLVMYTNNQLNKDGATAKLFLWRLYCNVSSFLLSVPSESVTEVRTNIYVTSFGPVSDTDMVSAFLLYLLLSLISTVSHQIFLFVFFKLNLPIQAQHVAT